MSESVILVRNGKARLREETRGVEMSQPLFPWSASRLKKLSQCPRQFRFAYLDGLPTTLTAPLAFGRAVHETIRCAHETQMIVGTLPIVAELLERFDALWNEALRGEMLFRPSHPHPSRYATMGHEMLRIFHAQNQEVAPPLMAELPFDIEIEGEDETFRLRGIIDRVDEVILPSGGRALVVVDYKSGSRKLKSEEAQADLQLTLYALALRQMVGIPVERVEFHLLRDGEILPSQTSEEKLAPLLGEVLPGANRRLASGELPPCPGYWCRWCDFREPCQQEGGLAYGVPG